MSGEAEIPPGFLSEVGRGIGKLVNSESGELVDIVYWRGWYDGPISGDCWFRGMYCWFSSVATDAYGHTDVTAENRFRFRIHPYEGNALLVALASRRLFEDVVGYHNSPASGGKGAPGPGSYGPRLNFARHWDKLEMVKGVPEGEDFSSSEPVGEFCL